MAGLRHPVTLDGRYFVVGSKLWRMSNPELDPQCKAVLVREVMDAVCWAWWRPAAGSHRTTLRV
jgi:hypothetical protein